MAIATRQGKVGDFRVSTKVKMVEDRGSLKANEVVEVHPAFAKILIDEKKAVEVKSK